MRASRATNELAAAVRELTALPGVSGKSGDG